MTAVTERQILDALGHIADPDKGADIVSLGMVSGLVIRDGNVAFAIEVESERGPRLEPLRKAAEKAVEALPGVLSVTAVLTAQAQPRGRPAPNPAAAARGPTASAHATPATTGTSSHDSRHLVAQVISANTTARTIVSCANSTWASTATTTQAARNSPRRGSPLGTRYRARRGICSACVATLADISIQGCRWTGACPGRRPFDTLTSLRRRADLNLSCINRNSEQLWLEHDHGQTRRAAGGRVVEPDRHRDHRLPG